MPRMACFIGIRRLSRCDLTCSTTITSHSVQGSFGVKRYLLLGLLLSFAVDAAQAKKDFKGLFGSYRREKFTENEANPSDFGIDLLLATMLPLSPVVKSQETPDPSQQNALAYSTFFAAEV